MKGLYKGLHKSTENYSNFFTKVNFFSIFNFPIRRHVIFSRMNIIFFNDTGDVILQCILSGEDHLCFFLAEGKYHISGKKKYHIHRICRKYHISMYFLRKIIFHFPSENKIMLSGKNTIIHNTRKVIFQCNFFRKTILSEHLEKKNLVFCAVIRNRSRGFVVTLCGFVVTLCCFGTTLCGFRVM